MTADAEGEVHLDALLPGRTGSIAIDSEDNLDDAVYFHGRTEGVTDEIQVDLATCIPAGSTLRGQFEAIDFQEAAVLGGDFEVWAVLNDDVAELVPHAEEQNGRYRFETTLTRAGCWQIVVTDLESGVVGRRLLLHRTAGGSRHRVCGGPRTIRARSRLMDHVRSTARLVDTYGNGLEQGRLTALQGGSTTLPVGLRLGDHTEIGVALQGHGYLQVDLRDATVGRGARPHGALRSRLAGQPRTGGGRGVVHYTPVLGSVAPEHPCSRRRS